MRRLTLATFVVVSVLCALLSSGCLFLAGAGAGGGAGYEYSNKRELEALERDYEAGRISKDQYLRRKEEIEERSLVY